MFTPGSGLAVAAGSAAQAMTGTLAKMTIWNDAGAAGSVSDVADDGANVVADLANNRIKLNCPGEYFVLFSWSGVADALSDITFEAAINGAAQAKLTGKGSVGTSARANINFSGFVKVTQAQVSAGLNTQTVLEVQGKSSGTPNLTTEYAQLSALRVG